MRSTIQPTLIFVLALFTALSIRSVDAQQLQLDFDRVENGVTLDFHLSSPAKMVTETYTVEVPYTENVPQISRSKFPTPKMSLKSTRLQFPIPKRLPVKMVRKKKYKRLEPSNESGRYR